jgi:hypothetical protein
VFLAAPGGRPSYLQSTFRLIRSTSLESFASVFSTPRHFICHQACARVRNTYLPVLYLSYDVHPAPFSSSGATSDLLRNSHSPHVLKLTSLDEIFRARFDYFLKLLDCFSPFVFCGAALVFFVYPSTMYLLLVRC